MATRPEPTPGAPPRRSVRDVPAASPVPAARMTDTPIGVLGGGGGGGGVGSATHRFVDRPEDRLRGRGDPEAERLWSGGGGDGADDGYDSDEDVDLGRPPGVSPPSASSAPRRGKDVDVYAPLVSGRAGAMAPPPAAESRPDTSESRPIPAALLRCLPPTVRSSPSLERLYRFLTSNALPDDALSVGGAAIADCPGAVRLFKFAGLTLGAIAVVHPLVRWVGWENDENYAFSDFLLYDLNYVMLDVISFFVVGRLYDRRGFDCLFPFILPMALGAIYPSWCTDFAFLRYSFSLYEIHCAWPPQLFVYTIGTFLLVAWVAALHVRRAYELGRLVPRLVELLALAALFVAPYASHPNFHLHHWYSSWLIGMLLNQDAWWSKSSLAFLWGQYVNGVAVYGRDPLLTCAYGYYVSTDIRCPYMECYYEEDHEGEYKAFVAPDWRNCSSRDNYIP